MKTLTTLIIGALAATLWGNEPQDLNVIRDQALRAARDAVNEAARQAQLFAQAGAPRVRARNLRPPARQIRTLVVSPKTTDPKAITEIEEDLAVMSRLLNKEVEKEVGSDPSRAMGIVITSWGNETKAPEAIYLEGYGALFTLNVNFPLTPPPDDQPEKKTAAPADSEWDRARLEVFGGNEANDPMNVFLAPGGHAPGPEYDADKVDNLKRAVLNTLRNATNIRILKPEDYVNVAVLSYPNRLGGGGAYGMAHATVTVTTTKDGQTVTKTTENSTDAWRQSTLTVRVKKADLDSYANGKLTLDELHKKAAITVY